jgi:GT2 family glycosyltransferase/glycosyltransferase involved in cell wall biosynthesis
MRVLLVVHGYPPRASGGTELYVAQLARELAAQGEAVTVLAREADPERGELAVRHEVLDRVPTVLLNNTYRSCASFADSYDSPEVTAVVAQVLDAVRPEVAHVHHLTGLATGLVDELGRRGVPVLMTLHDYWLMCHRGQLLDVTLKPCAGWERCGAACGGVQAGAGAVSFAGARALRAVEGRLPRTGRLLRGAGSAVLGRLSRASAGDAMVERARHMRALAAGVHRFLAPSQALLERFAAWGIPRSRLQSTELGADPRPFAGLQRAASRTLRLGFLGSLLPSKAPHVLLEALAMLPAGATSVDLVGEPASYHGDDSYRAVLSRYRGAAGVRWHGAVPQREVPSLLAGLDVLVVPSVWPENSPCVIREAFLAGLPVVASSVGGIPEMVRDGVDGLLVPPGDAGALAAALRRLVDDPALLAHLRAGVPKVRTITEDASSVRGHYRDLVWGPTSRSVAGDASPVGGHRHDLVSGPASRPARLAAVVLNYRTPDETVLAVRSLQSSRRPVDDIVVVDNASGDGSPELLRRRVPGVEVRTAASNEGFSAGCNLGIRAALGRGAELVLLLNGDALVDRDCLGALEAALAGSARAGIAGPVVLDRGDPSVIATAGISFSGATGRMFNLGSGRPRKQVVLPGLATVSAVSGCAMLVRREVLETVGLLEESYFFSFEDIDLCLRARAVGWTTAVASGALAYHAGASSIGPEAPRRLYYATRNHLLLAQRVPPAGRLRSLARAGLIVGFNLAHALLTSRAPRLAGVAAVWHGLLDYLSGHFGAGLRIGVDDVKAPTTG